MLVLGGPSVNTLYSIHCISLGLQLCMTRTWENPHFIVGTAKWYNCLNWGADYWIYLMRKEETTWEIIDSAGHLGVVQAGGCGGCSFVMKCKMYFLWTEHKWNWSQYFEACDQHRSCYRSLMHTIFLGGNSLFQQNNTTFIVTNPWFQEHSVNFKVIHWPLYSPDLNPIEYLWDIFQILVNSQQPDPINTTWL